MKTILKITNSIATKIVLIAIFFMNATLTQAQTSTQKTIEVSSSLGTLKQINAGLLNVGYTEAGPANGTAVILLHG